MNKKTAAVIAACLVLIFVVVIIVQVQTTRAEGPCITWSQIKTCYGPNPRACCSWNGGTPKDEINQP